MNLQSRVDKATEGLGTHTDLGQVFSPGFRIGDPAGAVEDYFFEQRDEFILVGLSVMMLRLIGNLTRHLWQD